MTPSESILIKEPYKDSYWSEASSKNSRILCYRSFLPRYFITASLPLRDVKKNDFERKYNNIALHLSSPNMVPYGKYGRLLLSILTTHAVQSKNNLNSDGTVTIHYDTLQSLLDEMQLPKQRSKDIKEQLNRFKSTTFSYDWEETKLVATQKSLFPDMTATEKLVSATRHTTGNVLFMDSLQYIDIDEGSADKRSVAFTIVLSNKFIELCKNHSVPIDYTVYKDITSALGKDLYAWLVYRNNDGPSSIGKDGLFIPRSAMVAQFSPVNDATQGRLGSRPMQEKQKFDYIVKTIHEIKTKYYPCLKYSVSKNGLGLMLYKSPQIMEPKDTRYILVTGGPEKEILSNSSDMAIENEGQKFSQGYLELNFSSLARKSKR